jgi:uncharacterized membrane protein/mono/diheme cytochrome c family protein
MRRLDRRGHDVSRLAGCALALLVAVPARADDPEALAGQVRAIFQAKCVECHGADLARPKGKFGYVLDLARVAANPNMVVPGDPARSELYQMVFYNEMPGKGATAPPLTDEEKHLVKRWIEAGAPAAGLPADPPPTALTFRQRAVRLAGQFHPVTTHFPIALLFAALPAEWLRQRTRRPEWETVVRFCVTLGAAGAVVSAALGWCAAAFAHFTAVDVLAWHRWLGTATAVWAVWTAWLAGRPQWQRGFAWSLCAGIVLVGVAGYLGAALVFGLHHFTW